MRDYTRYSFYLALLVIIGLVGISFIPSFTFAGVKFKRANIFSELYTFADEEASDEDAGLRREDLDFIREMQDQAEYAEEGEGVNGVEAPSAEPDDAPHTTETWDLGGGVGPANTGGDGSHEVSLDNVTIIEDFSPDGAIERFCRIMESESGRRNVRIAFLGDSFIEGDIITADVREQLQAIYGGQGVGFVALSSVTAEYRPTVKHSFRGWKDYQIANKKNVPEEYRDRFYISGTISTPNSASAWANYETSNYRKYISEVSHLRFFYSSTEPADIKFTVNGEHERNFEADSSGALNQINIAGQGFSSLRVEVPKTDGFAGYGVSLEGRSGVLVDNYAIRSSTGLSLFGTSAAVNTAFNRMMPYDLIVLQYGLNIMSADITGYQSYGEKLRNLVNYIKRCFPSAAVIVMSVGDRSMQKDGSFVTMPAVPGLVAEQRSVAGDCGVGFWNTYQAMGGYNSMKRFAEWGWAAKDYTHLSFAGGRKIATEFVKALEYAKVHPYVRGGEEPEEGGGPSAVSTDPPAISDIRLSPREEPAPTAERQALSEQDGAMWEIVDTDETGIEEPAPVEQGDEPEEITGMPGQEDIIPADTVNIIIGDGH